MSIRITPAVKAQVIRFVRLFVVTFAAQEATLAGPVTRSALISAAVASVEVAVRVVWPAEAPEVTTVLTKVEDHVHAADPNEPGSVATS